MLVWSAPRLISQRQREGGVPICALLRPPSQRWQMCRPPRKYWELPGHLSGNIWAIWEITFCKWTQIETYVVALLGQAPVSHFNTAAARATDTTIMSFLFRDPPGVRSVKLLGARCMSTGVGLRAHAAYFMWSVLFVYLLICVCLHSSCGNCRKGSLNTVCCAALGLAVMVKCWLVTPGPPNGSIRDAPHEEVSFHLWSVWWTHWGNWYR